MRSAGRLLLRRGGLLVLFLVLSPAATPAGAAAQWQLEAAAGGVSHESAGAAGTTSNAMGYIRYDGPLWLYLSGGTPLGVEGLPWLASGAGGRVVRPLGGVELGIDVSAHVHGYRSSTTGETGGGYVAEALPFAALALGPVRLEGRTGIAHYSSSFAGQSISRTGHDSWLTAEVRPTPQISISGESRLFRAEEGDYPYFGAAAELRTGVAALWGFAGTWTSELLVDPTWGAGAAVVVGGPYSVRASYQQEATDPLFWNQTRRFWTVGITRTLGSGRPAVSIPAPVLPEMASGEVVFRVPAQDHPRPPSIAGDYNGWTPVAMTRSGADWVIALPVAPGVHHYAFRSADGTWFLPETVENRVDDGFGGVNGVLVVPPRQ